MSRRTVGAVTGLLSGRDLLCAGDAHGCAAPTTQTAATIARVTPQPATPAPAQAVSTARVLTTLMVPLFMALIAISVINVALPVIGTTLDADSSSAR